MKSATQPKRQISKNFAHVVDAYLNPDIRGVVLEGGSRSRKTFGIIDFILWLCKEETVPFTFNLVKETYSNFKTTLHNDFNKRLPELGILSPFEAFREVPSFRLFRNKFSLIGADQPSKFEGAGSDFFWINEALPVSKVIFNNIEQRCERFWMMDFNPRVSDHWIFELAKRPDVRFVHSTIFDNSLVPKWELKKILSYEPTPENIENGTADDYMWQVYGLGKRASPEGVVFKNVRWINEFPTDLDKVAYGLDFGFTSSPSAIVKVGVSGKDMFIQSMFYTPTENADILAEPLEKIIGTNHVWADSAERGMISDLRIKGLKVLAAKKFPGSIRYGIDFLKRFRLHLVKNPDLRKEQENYKWRTVGGIQLDEPIDDFNHLWDAIRYASVAEFRHIK